jgi:hypothetical protein
MLPTAATAALALLAAAVPRPGLAPGVPADARGDLVVAAYWSDTPAVQPVRASARKRVVRDKPARMIDDAVRQRALEAVQRSLAVESPPA